MANRRDTPPRTATDHVESADGLLDALWPTADLAEPSDAPEADDELALSAGTADRRLERTADDDRPDPAGDAFDAAMRPPIPDEAELYALFEAAEPVDAANRAPVATAALHRLAALGRQRRMRIAAAFLAGAAVLALGAQLADHAAGPAGPRPALTSKPPAADRARRTPAPARATPRRSKQRAGGSYAALRQGLYAAGGSRRRLHRRTPAASPPPPTPRTPPSRDGNRRDASRFTSEFTP